MSLPDKLWVRRGEAREYLGLSEHAFTKLLRSGVIKPTKFPGMVRAFFSSVELKELAKGSAECRVQSAK